MSKQPRALPAAARPAHRRSSRPSCATRPGIVGAAALAAGRSRLTARATLVEVAPGVHVATSAVYTTTSTVVVATGRDVPARRPGRDRRRDRRPRRRRSATAAGRRVAVWSTHPHWDHLLDGPGLAPPAPMDGRTGARPIPRRSPPSATPTRRSPATGRSARPRSRRSATPYPRREPGRARLGGPAGARPGTHARTPVRTRHSSLPGRRRAAGGRHALRHRDPPARPHRGRPGRRLPRARSRCWSPPARRRRARSRPCREVPTSSLAAWPPTAPTCRPCVAGHRARRRPPDAPLARRRPRRAPRRAGHGRRCDRDPPVNRSRAAVGPTVPGMTPVVSQLTIDSADPHALARWWSEVLGWPVVWDPADDEDEVEIAAAGRRRDPLALPPGRRGQDRQEPSARGPAPAERLGPGHRARAAARAGRHPGRHRPG